MVGQIAPKWCFDFCLWPNISVFWTSPINSEYGFYRHENTSECLLQPDFLNRTHDICLNGELDDLHYTGWWWNISWFLYCKVLKHTHTLHCYNYTTVLSRYRRIPGDKCEEGVRPPRREDVFNKLCGMDISLPNSSNVHTTRSVSGPFLMTIIIHHTVARTQSKITYHACCNIMSINTVCLTNMSKSDVFLKTNMNFINKSTSAFKRIHK